jgi:hypothetical protein
VKDMNDQSPSKESLDLEKLNLEVQSLRTKAGLEKAKLELDIENLRRAFRRTLTITVLSASVPMLIAVIGWTIQTKWAQDAARRTEEYHREELYNKMLENFGSTNPSVRLGAVLALSKYAESDPEVITALVNRLASEEDIATQEQIMLTIGSLGKSVLPQVANANRRAAAQFAQDSSELVHLLSIREPATESNKKRYDKRVEIVSEDLTPRIEQLSLGFTLQSSAEDSKQLEERRLRSGSMHLFGLYMMPSYEPMFNSQLK